MNERSKKGGPAGFEFDCDSEPIVPGTKRGQRLEVEGEQQTYFWKLWSIIGAVAIAALALGMLIGRSF